MFQLNFFHQSVYKWHEFYQLLLIAFVYSVLASIVLTFSIDKGNVTIFWIPGGFALAILLVKGIRFWPAVLLGALIAGINVGDSFDLSFFIAIGNTLESISCAWLLRNRFSFDENLTCISDLLKLAVATILSSSLSAIIGPFSLFVHGNINAQNILHNMLHWWGADTIGIILGTPLFLVWRKWPSPWFAKNRIHMTLGFFLIVFLTGQVVFLDWFHDELNSIAMGYWIFLLAVWAAVSFGKHGALLVIAITSTQALYGAVHEVGYFGKDLALTGLENFWFYLMIMTAVGVLLAISIEERLRGEQKLADSENRFRLFLNNNPIVAWMKDFNGRYVYLNQTYENRFDVKSEDWYGKTDFQIWPEHIAQQFRQNDLIVLEAFRTFEFEEQSFDAHNQPIDWMSFKFPFQDSLGNKFIGGIGVDITERKKIEAKLNLAGRVLNATQEGVMVTDAHRNIIDVNDAFTN